MGQTSIFTQELADEICAQLERGLSLNAICKAEGMPHESTVRSWARDDLEGFDTKYTRAREIGYLRLADEILEISDDGTRDSYLDDEGNERTNQDVIARSRLRVDSRKWLLSKMLPKVYGDKVEYAGTVAATIAHSGEIAVSPTGALVEEILRSGSGPAPSQSGAD